MMQYVNTVLVGKTQGTTISQNTVNEMAAGSIVMVDADGVLIKTTADAEAADVIKLGLITDRVINYTTPAGAAATIKDVVYSNYIPKNSVKSMVKTSFAATVEDKITFNFGSFTPVKGHRYVLRIVYKDLYEHPGQYTHTYEVVCKGTDLKADIIDKFVALINKDIRRRCVATSTSSTIVLTAMPKDDNEGKESINIYTRVIMEATMYYTDPSAVGFASKNKYPLIGLTITKAAGTDGKGNPKIVRDREQAALGYKGILNRTWWPIIKPELNVDLSKSYDSIVIEFEPTHANAEDSFRKTKQSVEVYIDNSAAIATTMIYKMIDAFVNGSTANVTKSYVDGELVKKVDTAKLGVADGVATLDSTGKLTAAQKPA